MRANDGFGLLGVVRSGYPKAVLRYSLTLNGAEVRVEATPGTPLLWVLRDHLGLTGTKYGCGMAQCGVCTVHVDGSPVRSCSFTIEQADGHRVTTIEGLSSQRDHALQKAWIAEQVPQCGYCQSGQLMAAAALLAQTPEPTDSDIDVGMHGLICRCGTYPRIRRAIHRAARESKP